MRQKRTLEVVVKVTERCNIDCTYCYVFNKGDTSYEERPIYMPEEVVQGLARFIAEGIESTGTEKVIIIFHGGEPLMMKKARFAKMCRTLNDALASKCELSFSVQTNAILVDDEWIDIFDEFQISVGVSLDGPKEFNDKYRIDHHGRGTYDQTVLGLKKLKAARNEGLIPSLGILTVITPELDAKATYRHFVDDLGIDAFNFLLPIDPHDGFNTSDVAKYGNFLCTAFDEWVSDKDPNIHVRVFNTPLNYFRNGLGTSEHVQQAFDGDHTIFTIASNGDLGPDDTLRTIASEAFGHRNVLTSKYLDFYESKFQKAIRQSETTLPTECNSCSWKNLCRGGAANGRLINRYSSENGFNNPSVLCDALQNFYSHVAAHLLRSGLGFDRLTESLIRIPKEWAVYSSTCAFAKPPETSAQRKLLAIPVGVRLHA